jgi:hypothetical protein
MTIKEAKQLAQKAGCRLAESDPDINPYGDLDTELGKIEAATDEIEANIETTDLELKVAINQFLVSVGGALGELYCVMRR